MKHVFDIHVLTVVVATSYVTLGIGNPAAARSLWFVYGAISFVLAVLNLMTGKR